MKYVAFLLFFSSAIQAQLVVDGERVDDVCVWKLFTKLNGDDIIESVSISRTPMRGCQNSNESAPNEFSYFVHTQLTPDTYLLRAIEIAHGSMGSHESFIIVNIHKVPRVYWTDEGFERHEITVMTKWGEIAGEANINAFLADFERRQGEIP